MGVSPSGKISFWLFQFLLFLSHFRPGIYFLRWKNQGRERDFIFRSLSLSLLLFVWHWASCEVRKFLVFTFLIGSFLIYFSRLTRLIFDCVLRVCCSVVSFGFVQSTLLSFFIGVSDQNLLLRENWDLLVVSDRWICTRWEDYSWSTSKEKLTAANIATHLSHLPMISSPRFCYPELIPLLCFVLTLFETHTHTNPLIFGNNFGTILVGLVIFECFRQLPDFKCFMIWLCVVCSHFTASMEGLIFSKTCEWNLMIIHWILLTKAHLFY